MWKQACGLFTLVVFFSKSQWRCSIPRCSFRSDVGSVIWCLCQNLYQQRTIIVNLVNVYKVQHLAAGLCSPRLAFLRLCLFFIFLLVFFMRLCVLRGCVWRALRVAERSSGCHRGAPLRRGGGVFNKCMLMSEAATMWGDARALLLFTAVFVHRSESAACKWHYCPWWMSIRVNSF